MDTYTLPPFVILIHAYTSISTLLDRAACLQPHMRVHIQREHMHVNAQTHVPLVRPLGEARFTKCTNFWE